MRILLLCDFSVVILTKAGAKLALCFEFVIIVLFHTLTETKLV